MLSLEVINLLVDFHIFPLGGVDVILGVSWLRTLKNVYFNWDTFFMECKSNSKKVLIKGEQKMDIVNH